MIFEIPSTNQLAGAAKSFLEKNSGKKIFAFYGSMGAGKTTFIKALCEQMGITDVINSPTFAIINEYSLPSGNPVYHFDFYRIENTEEAYDLGYEEYFYGDSICFIEWPEKVEALLPDNCTKVYIKVFDDGTRIVEVN